MTEKEKSLAGLLYDTSDAELADRRALAHDLCTEYNLTKEGEKQRRTEILDVLLPHRAPGAYLQGPIYFDYGDHIHLGKNFYANFHFTVLDCGEVKIGDDVMIGAGSVVVKDIPAGTFAAGSPCRPIRPITEKDRLFK